MGVLFVLPLVQAQTWQSLNGPIESSISKIIVRADTIYVASVELGGFFKKHKDADHWIFMDVVVPEEDGPGRAELAGLNTIEIGQDGIYYVGGSGLNIDGVYYNHFYISEDFGKSWEVIRNGIDYYTGPQLGVHDIFISGKGSLIVGFGDGIFTYSEEEELFKETSGNAGVHTNRVFTFHEYEDTLLAGRVTGIEYSKDDGNSWTASSFDSVEVFSIAYMDGKLFAGTSVGLYTAVSINGTFEPIEDLSNVQVLDLHTYQNQLMAGTDAGLFIVNPSNFDVQPVFKEVDFASMKAINNTVDALLIGSNTGFFECDFEEKYCTLDGVPNSKVRAMSIPSQDTLFTGTIWNIYRYFIPSKRWDTLSVPVERAKSFISASNDSFYTVNDNYFFVCSFQSPGCDSTRVEEPGSGSALFDLKQNTAGDLFIASRRRVFKSTDKGKNWEVIYTSSESNNFSLVTYSDSLLFINNDRIRFNLVTNTYDTLSKTVNKITQDGTIYSNGNGIHKSTDLGETWTTLLHSSDIIGGDFLIEVLYDETAKKLYAIGTGGRVYVSTNEGATWGVNEDMVPVYLETAAIGYNGSLYLGTRSSGVFKNIKPLNPPITISNEEEPNSSVPKSFKLLQNYPNPFNPSTTVPFELNQPGEVVISLFNVFGQKIRDYNLGPKNTGTHQHRIDLQHQASGVYFLRVKAGEHSQTIKISLIK